MVEYGDFECPFCAQAEPVMQALRRALPEAILFAFRHFPLAKLIPHSLHAAEAAEAAGAQGKFWQMHDILFAHKDALEDEDLVEYAAAVGCDVTVRSRNGGEQIRRPRARRFPQRSSQRCQRHAVDFHQRSALRRAARPCIAAGRDRAGGGRLKQGRCHETSPIWRHQA